MKLKYDSGHERDDACDFYCYRGVCIYDLNR